MAEQKWEARERRYHPGTYVVRIPMSDGSDFELDRFGGRWAHVHGSRESAQARADQLNEGEGK